MVVVIDLNGLVPRVSLTGSAGQVGRAALPVLEAAGREVSLFDLSDGAIFVTRRGGVGGDARL